MICPPRMTVVNANVLTIIAPPQQVGGQRQPSLLAVDLVILVDDEAAVRQSQLPLDAVRDAHLESGLQIR